MKYCLALCAIAVLAHAETRDGDRSALDSLDIEQLMDLRVQTATLKKQSLQDAPASVTVITAEDIRRYGYRTLAEALAGVRSFYVTSDGPMRSVGARGFSLLGDYNTRFLVLINGHHMTDNVYSAMYYFGNDFPLDMELVEQIEIVRGPSSALYGSNGLFATVNIITRSPANTARAQVRAEAGSLGEAKLATSYAFDAGGRVKGLVSTSLTHSAGRVVDFPDLVEAGLSPSRTGHVGNESAYHLFADLSWGRWSVSALFGRYKAIVPTGWYGAMFGNTGTTDVESRNFVEAAWNRPVGENSALRWRTYYDQFRYDGVYDHGSGYRNLDGAAGDWVGSQLVYHRETTRLGTLTAGGEVRGDLRNLQYNADLFNSGGSRERHEVFLLNHPRAGYGVYAQQELKLSRTWTAYLGGRLDHSTNDRPFVSPRAALVYQDRDRAYKFMYGRAFRNPSTYERYWQPNASLAAEKITTLEIAREQKLRRRIKLITSAFHYRLGGLIVGVPVTEDKLQYRNVSKATATGVELEVNGRPKDWLETAASFSMQRTRGAHAGQRLENSPVRLGQARASLRLINDRLLLAGAVRYLGSRLSAYGDRVPAVTLADVTVTATRLHPLLELQFGIRNLWNTAYADPMSPEHATRLMPGPGRSVYARLAWRHE
ncbi:MAG: TonB-dependent receptor plug domain-containing protein [Bryobacteraceae bacterium]